jgi:hypothetical protein
MDMAGHPNAQLSIAMSPDNNPADKTMFSVQSIASPDSQTTLIECLIEPESDDLQAQRIHC